MPSGIYKIENTVNGKCYIGSAVDLRKRWRKHRWYLERGDHHSRLLQHAWSKYGESAFVFSILLHCEVGDLLKYEQLFLNKLPQYNVCPTAGSVRGRIHSVETRLKMSITQSKRTNETCLKISESKRGRLLTDDHRNALTVAWSKRILTLEQRKALGDAARGNTYRRGVVVSAEARQKMSESAKRRWAKTAVPHGLSGH